MRKAPTTSISDMMSSTIIMTIFMCRLRSICGPSPLVLFSPDMLIRSGNVCRDTTCYCRSRTSDSPMR